MSVIDVARIMRVLISMCCSVYCSGGMEIDHLSNRSGTIPRKRFQWALRKGTDATLAVTSAPFRPPPGA